MQSARTEALRRRISQEHLLSRGLCAAYILLFSLVHILFFRNGFFDINRSKYYLLVYTALATAGLCGLCLCLERFWKRPDMRYEPARPSLAGAGAALMLLASIVSVCLSKKPLAALTGSDGRYAGGLFIGTCIALFGFGSWAGVSRRAVVIALSISGGLCALLGVLNFLHIDPLGFYVASLQEIYRNDFISTIGNINFFSAYMCLVMGLAAGSFVRTRKKAGWAWLLPFVLGVLGALVSRSESGMMGLAAIFAGMCVFKLRTMREAGRACILLAAVCFGAVLMGELTALRSGDHMELYEGIARAMMSRPWPMLGAGVLSLGAAAFFRTRRETPENARRLRMSCNILAALCGLAVAIVIGLMVYYTAVRPDIPLSGLAEYLRMDSHWGTFRGFIWKKTVSLYAGLEPLRKLFGIGPDSLKALLVDTCYDEMVQLTGILFDNAHNEYLQYLITIGAAGLAGYLLLIAGVVRNLWRQAGENPALFACALAIAAHLVQSVFNIAQPETTPAVFLLFALAARPPRRR